VSNHPYFIARKQPLSQIHHVMKEARLYNAALLVGVIVLLLGIVLHTWKLVAFGALIAGVGGWFGMLSTLKKH
jgi:hypothetical protein